MRLGRRGHRFDRVDRSVMPGRIGARKTPLGTPASLSRCKTRSRFSGGGVPGSINRHSWHRPAW